MIQLTDGLQRFFYLLVVTQPLAHLRDQFAWDAELPGAAAGVTDGEKRLRMSFPTGTLGASAGVMRRALDQGAAQDLARRGQALEEPAASLDGLPVCHLYR